MTDGETERERAREINVNTLETRQIRAEAKIDFLISAAHFLSASDVRLLVRSDLRQRARVRLLAELPAGKWQEDLASAVGIQTSRCRLLHFAGNGKLKNILALWLE